jgi:hypothetical protein
MSLATFETKFKNVEHSTCVWLEKEYVKLHDALPTIEKDVDAVLPYVSMLLQTVLEAMGQTAAATEAGVVLSQAQSDLSVASAVVADTGATLTASGAISAVQSNLSGLLTAAKVTDAKSVATVTKAASELGTLATAVSAAVASK